LNIYLFELRAQIKNFAVWTAVILAAYFVLMPGVYPVFLESLDDVTAMLEGFPPEFAAAFGINIDDLFSYGGFFTFTYGYMSVIGAIMAASLSVSAFAREKRSKCTDFLLTKPAGRSGIFFAKLLSVLTFLAVTDIAFAAEVYIFYLPEGGGLAPKLMTCVAGFFFMQLVFLAAGAAFAVYARRVRSVAGIATAFGFAAFILSALYGLLEKEAIRFIAPLKYFDPSAVIFGSGFESEFVLTAAAVILALTAAAYISCRYGDTRAV
jgi:ABC-2 type transport system permease protein